MIYLCLPTRDEAATVGLVLWKFRQLLQDSRREYQLLVGDDASSDQTTEVLAPYLKTLPVTVLRNEQPIGYAATVERLLREALERSDRHKRDVAVLWPVDYTVDPEQLEEFLKKLDSGADLVVGEATVVGEARRGHRLVRRWAPGDEVALLLAFGGGMTFEAPLPAGRWRPLFDSRDPRWGGTGGQLAAALESRGTLELPVPEPRAVLLAREGRA